MDKVIHALYFAMNVKWSHVATQENIKAIHEGGAYAEHVLMKQSVKTVTMLHSWGVMRTSVAMNSNRLQGANGTAHTMKDPKTHLRK